jgi:hypothetical protein
MVVVIMLCFNALAHKLVQVAPTIPAVKLAAAAVEPLGPEDFVESVGRICRLAEEEHRSDAPLDETAGHITQKQPTDAPALKAAQHINLVEFAREARHPAIVWRALCKADQIAINVLDYEAKPTPVINGKGLSPLMLAKFEGRSVSASAPVRFIERFDVQSRQDRHIVFASISEVERHSCVVA